MPFALALALLLPPSPPDAPALRQEVLDNGLTVIVNADHRAAQLAISLRVALGAAEDPPGQSGAAHLLEHLLFEGTREVPKGDYDRLLAEAGARSNAWTDHDWTVYEISGPPGVLERALWLEADRLGHLLADLDAEALATPLAVVRNEQASDAASDDQVARDTLEWLLWPEGHPYRLPVLGTPQTLSAQTPEALRAQALTWMTPAALTLVIVGDVDAERALAAARAHLGALPARAAPARATAADHVPATPWLQGEERWILREDVARQSLWAAWQTVPRGHPDEPALDLIAALLSGWRGAPLDEALLRGRVQASEVATWTSNGRLGGQLLFHARRDDAPLAPLLRALDRAVRDLQRRGPDPRALERVRARLLAEGLRRLEPMQALAEALGECWVSRGRPDCQGQERERLMAVGPEALRDAARRWLGEDRVLLSVVSEGEERLALPDSREVYPP